MGGGWGSEPTGRGGTSVPWAAGACSRGDVLGKAVKRTSRRRPIKAGDLGQSHPLPGAIFFFENIPTGCLFFALCSLFRE